MAKELNKLRTDMITIDDTSDHVHTLEEYYKIEEGVYFILFSFSFFGAILIGFGIFLGFENPLNIITILGLVFLVGSLAMGIPILRKDLAARKEIKTLRASDAYINLPAHRERFWNDLTVFLADEYQVKLPANKTKHGEHYKSPRAAEGLEFAQEVNGVETIYKLKALLPYVVGEAVAKVSPAL